VGATETSITTPGRLLHKDVCGHVVNGMLPLDRPEQSGAGGGSIEAGTSLGRGGIRSPGLSPGETGAGDARIQNGVGEQAANDVCEVGARGMVRHPMVGGTEEGGGHAES
jgi:hypothetical protein